MNTWMLSRKFASAAIALLTISLTVPTMAGRGPTSSGGGNICFAAKPLLLDVASTSFATENDGFIGSRIQNHPMLEKEGLLLMEASELLTPLLQNRIDEILNYSNSRLAAYALKNALHQLNIVATPRR